MTISSKCLKNLIVLAAHLWFLHIAHVCFQDQGLFHTKWNFEISPFNNFWIYTNLKEPLYAELEQALTAPAARGCQNMSLFRCLTTPSCFQNHCILEHNRGKGGWEGSPPHRFLPCNAQLPHWRPWQAWHHNTWALHLCLCILEISTVAPISVIVVSWKSTSYFLYLPQPKEPVLSEFFHTHVCMQAGLSLRQLDPLFPIGPHTYVGLALK